MSILDSLTNLTEKLPDVNEAQHSTLLSTAMEIFGNAGGLSTLLNAAQSQGLGHIVSSWIGTGPNQSVSPDQVERIVGQERLNQLATRAGIPANIASTALTRILPVLVDKLTPQGKLPQAA